MTTDDDQYDEPCNDDEDEVSIEQQSAAFRGFLQALIEGDALTAGKSLRQLTSIDGYMKDVLADMLEGSPALESRFHWFLQFVARRKGSPPMSSRKERELEELVWKTVKKHRAHTHNLKATWPKAAQELHLSEGSIIKYYYKREHRKLGDLPDFSDHS